jgi:hypothetical protein
MNKTQKTESRLTLKKEVVRSLKVSSAVRTGFTDPDFPRSMSCPSIECPPKTQQNCGFNLGNLSIIINPI